MPGPDDIQVFLQLCNLSVDNMYELEAMGELLEQRGLLTKNEIIDRAKGLKAQAESRDPSAYDANPITETENAVIERIMEIILHSGLSSKQAKALLQRTITLLEWGERTAPKTTH